MKLKDFKNEERETFKRDLQNSLDERIERLEEIKKIQDFKEMKKEALDYEDEYFCTDIRENSTKEELIEAIDDEIRNLEEQWLELD